MSISDRLDEVRSRIVRAREDRQTDRYMVLDVDAPALVAALRAVLNLHQFYDQCDEGCCRHCESCEHEWPCPTVRAIAAAFGCGDGIDTTPERVHETPNREHIGEGTP